MKFSVTVQNIWLHYIFTHAWHCTLRTSICPLLLLPHPTLSLCLLSKSPCNTQCPWECRGNSTGGSEHRSWCFETLCGDTTFEFTFCLYQKSWWKGIISVVGFGGGPLKEIGLILLRTGCFKVGDPGFPLYDVTYLHCKVARGPHQICLCWASLLQNYEPK